LSSWVCAKASNERQHYHYLGSHSDIKISTGSQWIRGPEAGPWKSLWSARLGFP